MLKLLRLSLFFAIPLFSVVSGVCWAGEALGSRHETRACAHRGDVSVAPENTLPAIRSAVRKGAHQIEFDLQLTKDAKLVLMHDSTLKRTTGKEGKVSDLTLSEIRELDAGAWFSEEYIGTRVPTFEEVLEVVPHSILCNCHLKGGPEVGAAAVKVLQRMGRLDHCFLAATTEQAAAAKSIVPEVMICNMSRQTASHSSYADQTIELGCDFIQLLGSRKDLKKTIDRLHQAGVKVNFFYGNSPDDIRALARAGVDYILTDKLDLCLQVLEEQETQE